MGGRAIQCFFAPGGGLHRVAALQPAGFTAPRSPAGTVGPPAPAFKGAAVAAQAKPGTHSLQPHGNTGNFEVDPVRLGLARGGGMQIPAAVLTKMETALGADFSAVRIHVGPQAARIGAIAFTTGNDIYFAPGRYQPESVQGQQLLGHELAHVIQQRQGRVRKPSSGVAVVQDRALEAEADRLGLLAAAGRSASNNPIQRQAVTRPGPLQAMMGDDDCADCEDCMDCEDGVGMPLQAKAMPQNRWQKTQGGFHLTRSTRKNVERRFKGIVTSNILSYGRTRKRVIRLGQNVCAGYPNHVFLGAFNLYVVGRQILANGDTDVCFDRQRHAGCADIAGFLMTGTRAGDAAAANALRGYGATPVGYTWHHKHDFVPNGVGGGTCTMQLIVSDCHNNIFHHGAVAQWNVNYPFNLYG